MNVLKSKACVCVKSQSFLHFFTLQLSQCSGSLNLHKHVSGGGAYGLVPSPVVALVLTNEMFACLMHHKTCSFSQQKENVQSG